METVQSSQVLAAPADARGVAGAGAGGAGGAPAGRVHSVRGKGKMGFLVLRESGATVQCVLAVTAPEGGAEGSGAGGQVAPGVGVVSKGLVKYAVGLSRESVVELEGLLAVPEQPVESCTQQLVRRRMLPH